MIDQMIVQTPSRHYPIFFETGFFSDTLDTFVKIIDKRPIAIVTDEHVAELYLEKISDILAKQQVIKIVIPAGEQNKSLYNFDQITTILAQEQYHKNAIIIALGGGMIGDLAGFSAACYQRGIDFIQVPTSLLAQVDASVGGKTAINHPMAKNLIGAFYQPAAVFINLETLDTLPEREYIAGLAEVIKYGLIADQTFLAYLDANYQAILKRDKHCLMHIVKRCCELKKIMVEQDEHDKGVRQLLNFGHTFAHAIETGLGYEYLHGEAVAIGMVAASYLSLQQKNITEQEFQFIVNLLQRFRLPVVWPDELSVEQAIKIMQHDKKKTDEMLTLILLDKIGQARVSHSSPSDLVASGFTSVPSSLMTTLPSAHGK